MIQHPKLGDFNSSGILSRVGGKKSKLKGSSGLIPSEGSENPLPAPFWASAGLPTIFRAPGLVEAPL